MKLDRRQFLASAAAGTAASLYTSRSEPVLAATDPLGVRKDFPAASAGTYLNTPYIGPIPRVVEEAGLRFTRAKASDPIPLGAMLEETDRVRGLFANLFGAKPEEVAFLFATSEGENLVTRGLGLSAGDNVVLDDLHYETSYVLYKELERTRGVELRIAPSREGRADPEQFEPLVDDKTRIVSVSWVSHQNGFRHDLKGLSELAHAHGAYLYADAVQALGMFPASFHEEGVDFLTAGTYKWLLASYGVAPFYIREELLDRFPPDRLGWHSIREERPGYAFELYDTARKYEYATLAFGPVYQLGAALEYLEGVGLERIEAHTVRLARRLRRGLIDRGFRVRTPDDNASSIVAFFHGKDPEAVRALFEEQKVQVSFRENGSQIRAGAALFNDASDIEILLDLMERVSAL